jgi:ATP-dependent DNA ligase
VTLAAFSPSCSRTGGPNHIEGDGPTVFAHACKIEGIVSKRKDSSYRSGRSPDWLKNPACEAVKREAEKDWAKERGK